MNCAGAHRNDACSECAVTPVIAAIVEFFLRSLFDHIATQSHRE
jgi:hypothetical protein